MRPRLLMKMSRAALTVGFALAGACVTAPAGEEAGDGGKGDDPDQPDAGGTDPEPPPPVPEGATAVLEIYQLDVWAQFLPGGGTTLRVERDGVEVAARGFPVARVSLDGRATYAISLSASDHEPVELEVTYDGTDGLDAMTVVDHATAVRHGLSFSHDVRVIEAGRPAIPVHTLYVGLRHQWFSSAGRPARRGNSIDLLLDGEEAWLWVESDLQWARDLVLISTWWWESNFELVRDWDEHATLSPAARQANTIMALLEASPAVKRVIVAQFWGQDGVLDGLNADDAIHAKGAAGGDDFEFMGQANQTEGTFLFAVDPFEFGDRVRAAHQETSLQRFDAETAIPSTVPPHQVDLTEFPISVEIQHASWHQKFLVVDSDIAYVGGMNIKAADWDNSAHLVYDHRRMPFDASAQERQDVIDYAALPATGPRKDYMIRVQGPSAQDVAEVFQLRWDLLRSEGVAYADRSSAFSVARDIAAVEGGAQVQITTTLPDPLWEHSIAESWLNAVAQAEDYIYIEDQYFRAPLLNDAIIARMQAVPDLKLIVITKPINEWVDPGCEWTYRGHGELQALFPNRYMLLQLRSFTWVETWGFDEIESRFADQDVHSKMLIVDDKFLSVGSANKNNRGLIYEGEMNAAVLDPTWVRTARRRILANMLPSGTTASDDSDVWWGQLVDAADWNDMVHVNWEDEGHDLDLDGDPLPSEYRPAGFVYPMQFRSEDYCLIEGVGPDMM